MKTPKSLDDRFAICTGEGYIGPNRVVDLHTTTVVARSGVDDF